MENEIKQQRCPKCGKDNSDDARFCYACGCALPNTGLDIKISKLAILAFVCALCGLLLLTPGLAGVSFHRAMRPWLGLIDSTLPTGIIVFAASVVLGFVSLILVERGGGRITGRTFAVGAALMPVFAIFLMFWFVFANSRRSTAFRMVCGINLSGIGKAMSIYANDYDDEYPRAGGWTTTWAAKIPDWKAANRYSAYSLNADGTGGQASISSSLYLLVKYTDLEPKQFICKQDSGAKEFKLNWLTARNTKLVDLWDFGPDPWKHCSYSYHNPYSDYALNTSRDAGLAVAADRNPWMDSPITRAGDFSKFDPDGDRKAVNTGNTLAHKTDGQNVLSIDGHVGFERVPFCGINDDNIYTYWNGQDIRRGTPPKLGSQPADRLDSLLVNDPATPR